MATEVLQIRLDVTGADTASGSIKRTSDSVTSLEGTVTRVRQSFAHWGSMLTAVAGGSMVALLKSTVDSIDKIGKLSDRLGISTEALSELQHVADLSGVSFETMTMGLQRMTRRISEAAAGTGEAKNALKELGMSAVELNKIAPDKQFERLAAAIMSVENPADRVRLAMKLFDSEGVALIQTMKGGAEGIVEMRQEAERLGLSLDRDTVASAEEANDAITRLSAALEGARIRMAAELAPTIRDVANLLGDVLPQAAEFTNKIFRTLGAVIGAVAAAVGAALRGEWSEAAEILSWRLDELVVSNDGVAASALDATESATNYADALAGSPGERSVAGAAKKATNEVSKLLDKLEDKQRELQWTSEQLLAYELAQAGATDAEIAYGVELLRTNEALSDQRKQLEQTTQSVDPWATALTQAVERVDDAFFNLWRSAFDGFKDFKDAITNAFKDLIAQLIHLAITNPITLAIGGAITGTTATAATSSVASTATSALFSGITSALTSSVFAGFTAGINLGVSNLAAGGLMAIPEIMATAGELFSTGAISSAIGVALPVLLPILIGAGFLLSSLLGDKTDPRIQLATGGEVQDFEDYFTLDGPFGLVGFGGASHGMDAASEEFASILETIVALDELMASMMSPEQIEAVTEAFSDHWAGIKEDLEGFDEYDLGAMLAERFAIIAEYLDEGPIGDFFRAFTDTFSGTADDFVKVTVALVNLASMLERNPIEIAADALEQANYTAWNSLGLLADAVLDASWNFDGSADSLDALTTSLGEFYVATTQMLIVIDQLSSSITDMIGSTIESIRLSVMTTEEQYDYMTAQAEDLAAQLSTATDPEVIASLVAQIDELTSSAYNLLDEDQQKEVAEDFISFLESVDDIAQDQLKDAREAVEDTYDSVVTAVETSLGAVAEAMQTAADTQVTAAYTISDAASIILQAAATIPSTFNVSVNVDYAEVG